MVDTKWALLLVARQTWLPSMSETPVLMNNTTDGIILIDYHPKISKSRVAVTVSGITNVVRGHKFHVLVANVAETSVHLSKTSSSTILSEKKYAWGKWPLTPMEKKYIRCPPINNRRRSATTTLEILEALRKAESMDNISTMTYKKLHQRRRKRWDLSNKIPRSIEPRKWSDIQKSRLQMQKSSRWTDWEEMKQFSTFLGLCKPDLLSLVEF